VQPNLRQWSVDVTQMSTAADNVDISCVTAQNESRYNLLFEDSKSRLLRKKQIYANELDKECTFKPKLVAKRPKSVCLNASTKQNKWHGGLEYCTFSPRIN